MDLPFFSVVIPTHNRSGLLMRAIRSVLRQTFENYELIVVDDHSDDNTYQDVISFSDDRIRYMLNKRSTGACGARNTGIYSAKGTWIAFLDDDDLWLSDKLRLQYEKIINLRKTVGLICTDYAIYKGKTKKIVFIKNRSHGWLNDKILFGEYIGCLSSSCVRKEVLIQINGFDESLKANQDQDLWLRISKIVEVDNVPKTLVLFMQEQRKDRIGVNTKNKLYGWISYRNKYNYKIKKNVFLRHRFESNVFMYALLQKELRICLKSLPWLIIGMIINFPNFIKVIRTTAILINRNVVFSSK